MATRWQDLACAAAGNSAAPSREFSTDGQGIYEDKQGTAYLQSRAFFAYRQGKRAACDAIAAILAARTAVRQYPNHSGRAVCDPRSATRS
jgi:hypothetical protein